MLATDVFPIPYILPSFRKSINFIFSERLRGFFFNRADNCFLEGDVLKDHIQFFK